MTVLSYLVIGAMLIVSLWSIWSTLRPEIARIVDLLVSGPVTGQFVAVPVQARGDPRGNSPRAIRATRPIRRVAA